MANNVGKTQEFAEELIQYYINGQALPPVGPIYVSLLSGLPGVNDVEPYTATQIKAWEYAPGDFRAQIPTANMAVTAIGTGVNAVRAQNTADLEFDGGAGAPATNTIVGYCLVRGEVNVDTSAYIGYEIFPVGPKRREIKASDVVRINAGNLTILER